MAEVFGAGNEAAARSVEEALKDAQNIDFGNVTISVDNILEGLTGIPEKPQEDTSGYTNVTYDETGATYAPVKPPAPPKEPEVQHNVASVEPEHPSLNPATVLNDKGEEVVINPDTGEYIDQNTDDLIAAKPENEGDQNQAPVMSIPEDTEETQQVNTNELPEESSESNDEEYDESYLQSLTVKQLKTILRKQSLKVSGKKAELIKRIIQNSGSSLFTQAEQDEEQVAEQDEQSNKVKEEDIAFMWARNSVHHGASASDIPVNFNKKNGKLVEQRPAFFGDWYEIPDNPNLPEDFATPEARLRSLRGIEELNKRRDERKQRQRQQQPSDSLVTVFDSEGNRVVINEENGDVVEGEYNDYGQWLLSRTPEQRQTEARQARISTTLNDDEELTEEEKEEAGIGAEPQQTPARPNPPIDYSIPQPPNIEERAIPPKHPDMPESKKKENRREALNRIMDQYENFRVEAARIRDERTTSDFTEWLKNNPFKSPAEYIATVKPRLDPEGYRYERKLDRETRSQNPLKDYAQEISENGLREEAETDYQLQSRKFSKKQDKLIESFKRDWKRGFFASSDMRVEENENGLEFLNWSVDTQEMMEMVFRYVNQPPSIANQKLLMRSIREYASLSFDRQGKMFGEENENWELTEQEMQMIMMLMLRSCVENHTPFGIVNDGKAELRGTKMFPLPAMDPTVVSFWTGDGSNLLNADGTAMTPAQLVQRSQDEWNARTRPAMIATAPESQRIVIEDIARAMGMLVGISPQRFSERYGVRTEVDYQINEWLDSNAEYAATMNDYIDADAVREYMDEKIKGCRERVDHNRGAVYVYDKDGKLEDIVFQPKPPSIRALNFVTSLMRTAGVALNAPVIISAFGEKAVGNFITTLTINELNRIYGTNYQFSDFTLEHLKSDEYLEAFKCVKSLYDCFGPDAARLFALEHVPYTKENVEKFVKEKLKPPQQKDRTWEERMRRFSQKFLVADYALNRQDIQLWFNAYVVSNAIAAQSQQNRVAEGKASARQMPLTPEEIESAMRASDAGTFFAQAMGSDAGVSAYQMLKANNIGQKSPFNGFVHQFLSDHEVTNFAITAFLDTYPEYGLNFVYMLCPFSRTIGYMRAHHKIGTGEEFDGLGDLYIGGNIEDYQLGLRMNLIYDAYTFGCRSVITGGLLGIILFILGWDPPDDDINKNNVSMWKIGKKVGWGEKDENGNPTGIELQKAWWINDLTLLSLPIAAFSATWMTTRDLGLAKDLAFDSLADTMSGNVLLDFAHVVNHWREDYIEFERMSQEADYEGPKDFMSFAGEEAAMACFNIFSKVNPLDPLVNTFNRDTLFAGEDARNKDFWHKWKRSDDEELDKFYQENKVTERVSYDEGLRRKYSSHNLIFAFMNSWMNGSLKTPLGYNEKETSFFWWDMPARTMGDTLGYAWMTEFAMDLNNIPKDIEGETAAEKELNFKDKRAKQVLDWIDRFDGATNQAIDAGFCIPEEARNAATNYCFAQISALKADYAARIESGELSTYEEQTAAKEAMWDQINNKWNKYIYDWLKNDDIPSYAYKYEQLLTDYEVTYVWRGTNQPAPTWASMLPGMTTSLLLPKGNHPTSFAPFTVVDVRDRGFNAETLPVWYSDGTTGSDLQWIYDNIGKTELQFGRDKGKIANDVIFGKQISSDQYKALNRGEGVLGWRSYVPQDKQRLPDSTRNITEENHEGGTLGETGEYNQDVEDILSGKGKASKNKIPTYYPRRTYGGYGRSRSGSSAYNYNPKIYSNPRSINADKAATMYTKTPGSARTTYLNPSFETKGSREAYKRQDL